MSLRLKNPRVTFGPAQPSCQSSPLEASIVAAIRSVSRARGTVPGTNHSLIVFVVYGPGRRPVNTSIEARSMSFGGLNWAIG